ncbi:hypothetical protein [Mumia sp. Pv 4-285]|uniref:hypothetical protein n=1 Tax=Mumia qirimensis TaxID=3234852 RepID=UPI00351CF87C
MLTAVVWGVVAASSFVVGGAVALWRPPRAVWVAIGAGFGAGALLSAVAYELIDEAGAQAGRHAVVALGLLGGAAATTAVMVGPGGLRRAWGAVREEPPVIHHRFATLLLSVAAEVVVIVGAFHLHHGVSGAVVVAVFLCGVPEAVVATALLVDHGRSGAQVMQTWVALAAYGGAIAAGSHLLISSGGPNLAATVLAFAGGVVLAGITSHLVPTAVRTLGPLSAFPVVAGFALSVGLVGVA